MTPLPSILALAIAAVALVACTSGGDETVQIEFTVQHGGGVVVDEARQFTTPDGVAVELTVGYIALRSVELLRCETSAGLGKRLRRAFTLVPAARAHTSITPTRLGVPFLESVTRPDDERASVGRLDAPREDFCSIRLDLGPADIDAVGFVDVDDMFGQTLELLGTYDSVNELRVVAIGAAERDIELTPPLRLSTDPQPTTVAIDFRYNAWLDGLDLTSAAPADFLARVAETAELR